MVTILATCKNLDILVDINSMNGRLDLVHNFGRTFSISAEIFPKENKKTLMLIYLFSSIRVFEIF